MRHNVFAYGTLMFPEIAAAVTGGSPARQQARLDDHARHALRDRPFPGAVPRRGAAVDGMLLQGLSPAALERIDAFEGELYRRCRVRVCAADGTETRALTYLLRPRWHPLLLGHDWCDAAFRQHWHAHYLQRLSGASASRPPHRAR